MGIDISGWVEVFDPYTGEWDGVIRINYLVGRTPKMFALLFGVGNQWNYAAVVANRGFPMDSSSEVVLERRAIKDKRTGEISPSWIAWSEIEQLPFEGVAKEALVPSWEALFDLMRPLANRYTSRGVRLVVWFRDDGSPS